MFVAAGCSGAGPAPEGSGAPANSVEPTISTVGTLLASVTLEDEHTVRFYEFTPGKVAILEGGKLGQAPRESGSAKTLVDVFRSVAPSLAVPPALVEADARVLASANKSPINKAAPAELPPPSLARSGEGPQFYNANDQAWALAHLCNLLGILAQNPLGDATANQNCLQGWNWANSGDVIGENFVTYANIGVEAPATPQVHLGVNDWTCPGIFNSSCRWQRDFDLYIAGGHWMEAWLVNGGPGNQDQFYSEIDQLPGVNYTVTLASYGFAFFGALAGQAP
jgi:hypothetical protein